MREGGGIARVQLGWGNCTQLQDYLVCTAFAKTSSLPIWLNSDNQLNGVLTVVAV